MREREGWGDEGERDGVMRERKGWRDEGERSIHYDRLSPVALSAMWGGAGCTGVDVTGRVCAVGEERVWGVRVLSRDSNVSLEYSVSGSEVGGAVGVASSNTSSGTESEWVWSNISLMTSSPLEASLGTVGVALGRVGVVFCNGRGGFLEGEAVLLTGSKDESM